MNTQPVSEHFDRFPCAWHAIRMLTPELCRAARGYLDWTQSQLAERANVSEITIRKFETGRHIPHPNNLVAIERAIEAGRLRVTETGGLEPIPDDET